jgi:hypothetical protein
MSSSPRGVADSGTRLKVHTLSFRAWALAGSTAVTRMEERFGRDLGALRVPDVERMLARLTEAERAELRAELSEVRMADASGRLTDAWAAAVVESAQPDVAVRAVSTLGKVNVAVDLTLARGRGMAVARRRRVHEDPVGNLDVDARDAVVEVTLFAAEDAWPALRRCLPPDDALRAPAHVTAADERVVHVLSDADRAALLGALDGSAVDVHVGSVLEALPTLDDAVRDAVADPVATVALAVMTGPRVSPGWVGLRLWSLGRTGLYSVGSSGNVPRVIEVERGAVAADLAWLLAGAYDVGSRRAAGEGTAS